MKYLTSILFAVLAPCLALAQSTGDVQLPVKSSSGPLTPVWITKTPGKILGWDNSGNLGAVTVTSSPAWSSITGTPTTLSGYGITDSITAATAASTYQPLITNGSLALSVLSTNPLARTNHTGTQAWSTITSTPTTLSGYGITSVPWGTITSTPTTLSSYGITDAITAATVSSTYAPLANAALTGTPTVSPGPSLLAIGAYIPSTAWVSSYVAPLGSTAVGYIQGGGNDSTGVVADPFHPFVTIQAAYNAGARVFCLGVGSFGDLSGGTDDILLVGLGATRSAVGNISNQSGNIYGNGRNAVSVSSIYIVAPDGTAGTNGDPSNEIPPGDGAIGSDAPNITVTGVNCASDIVLVSGNGGAGGYGGDTTAGTSPFHGGNGGNGGAAGILTVNDSILGGYAVSYAGQGGQGGQGSNYIDNNGPGANGGNGGNGGTAGQVILNNCIVGGMYSAAANGGAAGPAGTGSSTGDAGAAGTAGAAGNVTTYFTRSLSGLSNGESQSFWGSLINGTFYTD